MCEVEKLGLLRSELERKDREQFDRAYGKIKELLFYRIRRVKNVIYNEYGTVDYSEYIAAAREINDLSRKIGKYELYLPEDHRISLYAIDLARELLKVNQAKLEDNETEMVL